MPPRVPTTAYAPGNALSLAARERMDRSESRIVEPTFDGDVVAIGRSALWATDGPLAQPEAAAAMRTFLIVRCS
jgi:hypothetical protein